MYRKERGLVEAFLAGKMSRRSLIKRFAALGVSTGTAGALLNMSATKAMAADFDWMKHKGTGVKLLLNKHPYTDAMIANLDNFKTLTGMEVEYDILSLIHISEPTRPY